MRSAFPDWMPSAVRGWVILGLVVLVPLWFVLTLWVFKTFGNLPSKALIIPVTGEMPTQPAGDPAQQVPGGTILEAHLLAEGFWEMASPEELSQPGLENAAFRPTWIALQGGHFGAQGQACVLNSGTVTTENLIMIVHIEIAQGDTGYSRLEDVYQSRAVEQPLEPGTGDCYPYRLEFQPVPGARYRAVASMLITNLQDWLPGSQNCPREQPCPYGPQVVVDFELPSGLTGVYVGTPTPEPGFTPTNILEFVFPFTRTPMQTNTASPRPGGGEPILAFTPTRTITPTPSATYFFFQPPTVSPIWTLTPTRTATLTPRPPTRTPTQTPTPTSTRTRTAAPSPTATQEPTSTPTPTKTDTPLPTPTDTDQPPTGTAEPPTNTPLPDTDTPVPEPDTPVPTQIPDTDTPVPTESALETNIPTEPPSLPTDLPPN